jgi:Holliday junction resolvase RusA-like endonuclease
MTTSSNQGLPWISFFVPGLPAPGGSKRFVGFGKKTGRAILIDDAGERNKHWRVAVGWHAQDAMRGLELATGPLLVTMTFYMPRPKSHFRANGALRPNADAYPAKKPDTLKLARSTEDAMTGIVWRDDAQTVDLVLRKRYQTSGRLVGCLVEIEKL